MSPIISNSYGVRVENSRYLLTEAHIGYPVQFSYYINNRQPNGSLSNVLSRLAVGVRVDGDDETQRKEHEREGDQEETRHRVLACVPSKYR